MYDAVAESALVEELELGARVGRQRRLAPTEDDGPDEQVALVNQPGLESDLVGGDCPRRVQRGAVVRFACSRAARRIRSSMMVFESVPRL